MNFLGGHGLRFDDGPRLFLANDAENDFARLLAGGGPMHFGAASFEIAGELLEILVEVIDGLPFCFRRRLARRAVVGKCAARFVAHDFVFAQRGLDDIAMPQVVREHFGLFGKLF
jgi:hypothetical protein